jgi:RNA polymerase sigma factor (sigma-70 family)
MDMRFLLYENDIRAKAKSYFIPGMDWEDIAQELRLVLWLNLHKFKPKRASERTFANRIMENKIKDLAKSANRKKRWIDSNYISLDKLLEKNWS